MAALLSDQELGTTLRRTRERTRNSLFAQSLRTVLVVGSQQKLCVMEERWASAPSSSSPSGVPTNPCRKAQEIIATCRMNLPQAMLWASRSKVKNESSQSIALFERYSSHAMQELAITCARLYEYLVALQIIFSAYRQPLLGIPSSNTVLVHVHSASTCCIGHKSGLMPSVNRVYGS